MNKKMIGVLSASILTVLVSGCSVSIGEQESRETGWHIGKKVSEEEVVKNAWREVPKVEKLRVSGKGRLVDEPEYSPEIEVYQTKAMNQKEKLKGVYYPTVDEKDRGKLIVYMIGSEAVGMSTRNDIEIASPEQMTRAVETSKSLKELEMKLGKQHYWNKTEFVHERSSKHTDYPNDIHFMSTNKGLYAVHVDEQKKIVHDVPDEQKGIWSEEKIGDILGYILKRSN